MLSRRILLLGLVLVASAGTAAYGAYAQGTFLYRDADVRISARLDPSDMKEVEETYRFSVPAGARSVEIRRHMANEGQASFSFGPRPGAYHTIEFITPNDWSGAGTSITAVEPGPYEVRLTAKAPLRIVIGVYFSDQPYRP